MSISNLHAMSLSPSTTEKLSAINKEVQQFKQQGMPDPQIAAMMQSKYMDGSVPISALYGLLKQIQSASPTAPPTPQGDIATQAAQKVLAMKQAQQQPGLNIQQLQQMLQPPPQPMPPQGGPPQGAHPQAMPPQAMPPQGGPPQGMRSGGLAGLPVHNIGKEYASGGIVAFDEGGNIQNELMADAYYDKLAQPAPQKKPPGYAHGGDVHHYAAGDLVGYNGEPTLGADGIYMPEYDEFGRRLNTGIDTRGHYRNLGPIQWQENSPIGSDYFHMNPDYGKGFAQMAGLFGQSPSAQGGAAKDFSWPSKPDPFSKYMTPASDGVGVRTKTSVNRLTPAPHDYDDPDKLIVKAGDLDSDIEQIRKYREKYGVDAGFKKLNELLDGQEKSLNEDKGHKKNKVLATLGLEMARASSIRGGEPGYGGQGLAGVLSGLSAGASKANELDTLLSDKYRAASNQLLGDRIKAQMGFAQDNSQMINEAIRGHKDDLRLQAQTTADAARLRMERESRASAERIAAAHDANLREIYGQKVKPEDQIIARINQAYQRGDTAAVEAGLAYLKKVRSTAPAVQSADIGADSRVDLQNIKDVASNPAVMTATIQLQKTRPGTAEYDQAVQKLEQAVKIARQQDLGGGGLKYEYD